MKTVEELWDEAVDLQIRLSRLKSVVQNEGATRACLETFNKTMSIYVKDLLEWQQKCNNTLSSKLVATLQSVLQDQIKSGLFKYGVKKLTGLSLYTVEDATEEFVVLHAIQRGLEFNGNNEVSFTPAVCKVPFSYFYAEYEILTRDRLLELTNTKSPFGELENE